MTCVNFIVWLLACAAEKVRESTQHQGKIVIVFGDTLMEILEIPYEATVMHG